MTGYVAQGSFKAYYILVGQYYRRLLCFWGFLIIGFPVDIFDTKDVLLGSRIN